jgi:hypothetical protein
MMAGRATSTHELLPSERRFLRAMQSLHYGRFEAIKIQRGEVVLDPWPTAICNVKFGAASLAGQRECPSEFELKKQIVEFFEYVRAVDAGEIRTLIVHDGLPFSMEIEPRSLLTGEQHD